MWALVENVAFQKSSWMYNKRHYKRHVRGQWVRGHASRAVDGDTTVGMHSCAVLDNYYVDRPTWMVDLGRRTKVAGVKIVTWQAKEHGNSNLMALFMSGGLARKTKLLKEHYKLDLFLMLLTIFSLIFAAYCHK